MVHMIIALVALLIPVSYCAPPPCFSDIYCHGPLLHTMQISRIYEDSKTFVDLKMKHAPNVTMDLYLDFMRREGPSPTKEAVKRFLNDTFENAGSEFEDWVPEDWKRNPSFVDRIQDNDYRRFASQLNEVWKDLGRKMKDVVKENIDQYSIIWVPNPVIVPGGRFREFYYWDSYWIIQGLLLSEMQHTVKGMLSNFAYIVENYGHIPNGGRVYYLERSQPPLFVPMAKMYQDHTGDDQFIADNLATFDKEFEFWVVKHARVIERDGKNYTMFVYGDNSRGPRPESYAEDMESAKIFKSDDQKEAHYTELKAAAESGWDFSSRWFILNSTNKGNLTNIKTTSIIPVDLNAIIYWNAVILSEWHGSVGDQEKATYYQRVAGDLLKAVETILWHEEVGSWLDYDVQNDVKRDYFYPSNIAPLWTGCYDKSKTTTITNRVLKYLSTENVLFPGGIPTSQEHTGEQWDYPNAWPPLQHMMIVGLNNTGEQNAQRLAFELADRWVRSNYKAYSETDAMYEKYDATILGGHGGGGEYEVQLGFGWTNGIIMDLLSKFKNLRYRAFEEESDHTGRPLLQQQDLITNSKAEVCKIGSFLTGLVALLITLAASYIG